jgi:hypothetical protein
MNAQLIKIANLRPATADELAGRITFPGQSYKIVEQRAGRVQRVEYVQELHTLYTLSPTGPEVAEREDPYIQCDECEEWFPLSHLEYDELDSDLYTDKKCPLCGCWNCCTLHYETIPEFKARTESRPG